MKLVLFNNNKITKMSLPKNIYGSFWLTDELNNNNNIINIEAEGEQWVLKSNKEAKIVYENSYVEGLVLIPNASCLIEYNNQRMPLIVEKKYDDTIKFFEIEKQVTIKIGQTDGDILYNNSNVFNDYATLTFFGDGQWKISIKQKSKVYINNNLLKFYSKKLNVGDILYIYGLKIGLYNGMISINNILNSVIISSALHEKKFERIEVDEEKIPSGDDIKELDLYNEEDYFYKKPRMRRFIEEHKLNITAPPSKQEEKEMPLLLVIGPMLTMAITGVVTLANTLITIFTGGRSFLQSLPTLITSITMLVSSFLWPNLTRRYQKKQKKQREKERVEKYSKYLDRKRKEAYDVSIEQSQILKENLITLEECQDIILKKKRILWERGVDQKDFLTVRLGIGDVPVNMDISYQEEDFTMEETDELKDLLTKFVNESKNLKDVPVGYSFYNKKVVAIMGKETETHYFMDNILLQLLTFHSYDDLKIVFFTNNKNNGKWDKYKGIPHLFSNDKQIRFFATNQDDIKYVSSYLEMEYMNRANSSDNAVENENQEQGTTFSPYYLIITDDYSSIRNSGISNLILKNKLDLGFSIICVENSLGNIPGECTDFISIQGNVGTILTTNLDNYTQQNFNKEINYGIDMNSCCEVISNIPIRFDEDNRYLPTTLGFLEMYNVGKIEHLNSHNRWRINNPIKSLRAQVGVNDEASPIYLDLHEKYHGPHGLIAGTTGSGKSEFIITYILSMVVNYSPNEVAFILIDYKGGGLAGAFENKRLGIKLPHLAGTITNLDKASLNRTLVSINSELQRRQKVFNEARDKLGESTIDIYKYQQFFREGKLDEPMPHLFIISDEFAELKAQQPEFMDDLISAARIGRSLGVHLILATQKPSGVVNDQIWSNSKFRVCLKVQDTSDSNGMLKTPDAASITNPGRFYLQVGNNEIYVLGQSGWAGTSYCPSDSVKKNYDRSISYIDEVGNVVQNISDVGEVKEVKNIGDELSNILKYVISIAEQQNVKAKSLWLESLSPTIYVDDLMKKYKVNNDPNSLTAILGEYDDPSEQYQDILTLELNEEGNTVIYGNSSTNREMMLSSIIYSLCTRYSVDDINIYILDFGSETLRIYSKFPQVGDITFVSERDKVTKLLSLINEELAYRKKLFADYNGEYKQYCKKNGKTIPIKLIIINNYDSFKENYENLEDLLARLTRECQQYGILFYITLSSARSIYGYILRNFKNIFVLDMLERDNYINILGKLGNVYPADFDGRGLFKKDKVLEFQTSQIFESDSIIDFLTAKQEFILKKETKRAPKIPVLPEEITLEMLTGNMNNIKALPIGMNKNTLKISTYDFFEETANLISSKNIVNTIELLKTIITGVKYTKNCTVLIDTEQELSSIGGMVDTYVDKNFEDFILKFENFLDREVDGKNVKLLCIIAGLEKFQGSMNEGKFKGFFNGIKTFDNVNLIFVDSSYKLKKVAYEQWYTGVIDNSNGIWVGPGFIDQAVIKASNPEIFRKIQVENNYAFVVKHGDTELIKIVGGVKQDEE